jgi:DNA-binding XRE family transcriptional regulator
MSELQHELRKLSPEDAGRISRLLKLSAMDASVLIGEELREAREAAGLSAGQAAKLLDIHRDTLLLMESDAAFVMPVTAAKMNKVYGLDDGRAL